VSFGLDLAKVARWARWAGRKGPDLPSLARGALDSLTFTEDFIARNSIDCDYHRRGRLVCASTPRHYEAFARRAETLNRLFDGGARVVSRGEQLEEIGSDRFHGALVIERSGQLDPARYVAGLLRLCDAAGVSRHPRTPVMAIERAPGGFRVVTSAGTLACGAVVVATNAHSARLRATDLGRRVIPVASHIIVTEPLAPELVARLLPKRRTGADSRRVLAYFRRTPDGERFLYGSRAAPFEVTPARAAAVLYRRMVASFPALAGARISHAWGCKVAFTLDALPHMGEIGGVHYVAGCNGNGVAMMTYLGNRIARRLLEPGNASCVFDRAEFPKVPLYDGRPWFLPAMAAGYRALDYLDSLHVQRKPAQ
jgi:glycine/D-amino acid oxidase-like deaminating enzyme